jgi:3-dehydroquinate synthase
VRADEREGGVRQVLNFGHTIGHAIEAASDFTLLHGDAIAIGMALESALAERLGVATHGTHAAVCAALDAVGLPTRLPEGMDAPALIERMRGDKKARAGRLVLALPARVGAMAGAERGYGVPVNEDDVRAVLA